MEDYPQLRYYHRNKEEIKAKKREAYKDPKVKAHNWQIVKKSRAKYPDKVKKWAKDGGKRYREKYPEKDKARHARQYRELRLSVLESLGGVICKMCGYDDYRALQIDHINGGGMKHIKSFTSNKTYLRTIKGNTLEFQVLCANCNRIKVYENKEWSRGKNSS